MKAVFFVYSNFRKNIYLSLANDFQERGYEISFIVQDFYTHKSIKKLKFNVEKLNAIKSGTLDVDLRSSVDVATNTLSISIANDLYISTLKALQDLNLTKSDVVFGGNGYHVQDFAILAMQCQSKYSTCFTELSNIPGKVFFDSKGSNLRSRFYELTDSDLPNSIEEYSIDEGRKLIESKRCSILPQSKKNNYDVLRSFFLDYMFGYHSHNVSRFKSYTFHTLINFAWSRIREKPSIASNSHVQRKKDDYLFCPLQVSSDSQIVLNSNFDNIKTIKYYMFEAKKRDLDLIVKIHPAEMDASKISEIINFCQKNEIIISSENTYNLIIAAKVVGVNNSTVGFESLLLGVDTIFIGKTFYNKMTNPKWIKYYVDHYLLNIDFYSGSKPGNLVDDILKIIKV